MHLSEPPINKILKNGRSKFANILTAANRAKELNDKEAQLLEEYTGRKVVSKALEELAAGKIEPNIEEE
ncbi:hypothetical protein JCM16358_24860 [Halanaerocella petrolearia]